MPIKNYTTVVPASCSIAVSACVLEMIIAPAMALHDVLDQALHILLQGRAPTIQLRRGVLHF